MTSEHTTCEVCGEGRLEQNRGSQTVELNGNHAEIPLFYSVCDCCGAEQINATQARNNKRAMVGFKKTALGLLSGAAVREIRQSLSLKQREASQVFGGGPVAFSKYESDDVVQAESMDRLLRVARESHGAAVFLLESAGIPRSRIERAWIPIAEIPGYQTAPARKRPQIREEEVIRIDDGRNYRKAS